METYKTQLLTTEKYLTLKKNHILSHKKFQKVEIKYSYTVQYTTH